MRDAGLIELGRHHPDVVRQRTRDLLDHLQAGGMDAVVVGAENSHPPKCLFVYSHALSDAPSYPARTAEANPATTKSECTKTGADERGDPELEPDPNAPHRGEFCRPVLDPHVELCGDLLLRWARKFRWIDTECRLRR